MGENIIASRIERALEKLRESAPNEEALERQYRTAKGQYESAVLTGTGDGFINEAIIRNYAKKEACKRYAAEQGFILEVKR